MKEIKLPDGGLIIDGFSKLLILTPEFVEENSFVDEEIGPYDKIGDHNPCTIEFFTTKAGREAIRIRPGNSHNLKLYYGSCDRYWNNWDARRPVNASFAEAVATSRGGGCWAEVIIMQAGISPITAEQAEYMEEIS